MCDHGSRITYNLNKPKTKTELEQVIDNGCNTIPQKMIQQYILHISNVMQEIVDV